MPKKAEANQPALQASPLAGLANLGPKSAQFLHHAGITSLEELEQLGSVKAYSMIKQLEPIASLQSALGARRSHQWAALA